MGVFNTILGGGELITKGFDLIDSMHTSESEAIEARTESKTRLMASYAPFKVAQRYLALLFGFTYVSSYIMVLALFFAGRDTAQVIHIIDAFSIDWIMLTIVAFYFGGGAAEGLIKRSRAAKNDRL